MAGFRVRNPAGYRDSMIQVVDPTTGDLLATARYPRVLGGFVDPGHVLSFDTDDLGRSYIREEPSLPIAVDQAELPLWKDARFECIRDDRHV